MTGIFPKDGMDVTLSPGFLISYLVLGIWSPRAYSTWVTIYKQEQVESNNSGSNQTCVLNIYLKFLLVKQES